VPDPSGGQSLFLLTDGMVMVQGGAENASEAWYRVTPCGIGSYINGTIRSLASRSLLE
jgi:hypothetical protein